MSAPKAINIIDVNDDDAFRLLDGLLKTNAPHASGPIVEWDDESSEMSNYSKEALEMRNIGNASILKMNDVNCNKFIQCYKTEPVLWDVKRVDYNRLRSRRAAAKRIVDALKLEDLVPKDFTETHVTTKFRELRSSYLQEIKKIEESTRSGISGNCVYIPKMVWFKTMDSFLRPQVAEIRPIAQLNSRNRMRFMSYSLDIYYDYSREPVERAILAMDDVNTITFIECYQNEPSLWDTSHEDYRIREMSNAAVQRIEHTLKLKHMVSKYFTLRHVQAKFKNLRNSYLKELKKIADRTSTGCSESSDEVYVPKVVWFKTMDSFLRPHIYNNLKDEVESVKMSDASILKMDDANTVKFLECYQNEPVLWDTKHKFQRNSNCRLAAAKRVANALNAKHFTEKHVVAKFRILRNSYLLELKKIAESARSRCSTNVYFPKVAWFKKMDSFLRPHVTTKAKLNFSHDSDDIIAGEQVNLHCEVPNCKSNGLNKKGDDGLTFHLFPNNEYNDIWLKAINLPEHHQLAECASICSVHFAPNAYQQCNLKSDAIPTLLLGPEHPDVGPDCLNTGTCNEPKSAVKQEPASLPDKTNETNFTDGNTSNSLLTEYEYLVIKQEPTSSFHQICETYFPNGTTSNSQIEELESIVVKEEPSSPSDQTDETNFLDDSTSNLPVEVCISMLNEHAFSSGKSNEKSKENDAAELLNNVAKIKLSEPDKDTPLMVASYIGDTNMVKMLLERNADIHETDAEGLTPLLLAVINKKVEIVRILMDHGAYVDAFNDMEETALMLACASDCKEIAIELIKGGAGLEKCDSNGHTPLMIAVKEGHLLTTTLLLAHGANVNSISRAGHSPLSLAYEGNHLTICEMLLAHGAKQTLPVSLAISSTKTAQDLRYSSLLQTVGETHSVKESQCQTDLCMHINKVKGEILVPVMIRSELGPKQKSLYVSLKQHVDRTTPEFRQWPRDTPLDGKTKHVVMNVLHHVMNSNSQLSLKDASAIASKITGVSVSSMLKSLSKTKEDDEQPSPEPPKKRVKEKAQLCKDMHASTGT